MQPQPKPREQKQRRRQEAQEPPIDYPQREVPPLKRDG
jgi:hypothetical protein